MKKMIAVAALLVFILTSCSETTQNAQPENAMGEININQVEKQVKNPTFEIRLQNNGIISGELYPEIAPHSVGNFTALANAGYYDGLIFHRVIPGFMIQGGCPLGIGTGGPGYSIRGEFSANGYQNNLKHTYGVLSMARSQMPNSAGSQFFIMTSDSPHLDGSYAAFGKVLTGMDEVEKIVKQKRNRNDRPLEDQVIVSIRVETYGNEYPFDKLNK